MTAANSSTGFACDRLVIAPPWEAWSISVDSFPINSDQEKVLTKALDHVNTALRAAFGTPHVFLQQASLHVDHGATRFASNARDWCPLAGLGIFPDREPPSTWTRKDFENVEPGTPLRPMCHKLFLLQAPASVTGNALQHMFGRGATLQIYTAEPLSKMLAQMQSLHQPRIHDKIFRRYPFFVSLFDQKVIESASEEELQLWSCGFSAYLRESPADNSIILISSVPLLRVMEASGLAGPGVR